jgi:hypothetical protein
MARRTLSRSAALACAEATFDSTLRRMPPKTSSSQEKSTGSEYTVTGFEVPVALENELWERVTPGEVVSVGRKSARAMRTAARAPRSWASACAMFWFETSTCSSSAFNSASP